MQAYNVPTGNRRCFVCLFHRKERSDERSTYMTVIIDYGAGNIKSVEKALLSLGQEVVITDDADTILMPKDHTSRCRLVWQRDGTA